MMTADRLRRLRLAAYLLAVLASLWLPAARIISHAWPAREPALYRFAAEDPYDGGDPFRGRYLKLRLKTMPFSLPAGQAMPRGPVYAAIAAGKDGLAVATAMSKEPFRDRDCVRTAAVWPQDSKGKTVWYAELPVDSCYLGARLTEQDKLRLRELFRSGGRKCTAMVRLYADGSCEVAAVEINGKNIAELLEGAR